MPHRRSWHSSPPLLSPPLIIILFPIVILTILFLALPPLLSAATRLIRPASVKTSWDSLNILIVVFAILCGVFARRNDDEQTPRNNHHDAVPDRNAAFRRVPSEGQSQWLGFTGERKEYINDTPLNRFQSPATGDTPLRMRRNSSSYPDLRQWETGDERNKFRFSDDFEIDKQFRTPARDHFPAFDHRKRLPESPPSLSPQPQPQPQHQHQHHQQQDDEEKEIPVDTFETRPSSPPVKSITPTPPPPPPPPPPQPESARRNARRSHRKTERVSEITVELDEREFTTIRSPPPAPPTPPPPSAKLRSERKSERKKSNVKREIAMVWASVLSNQRKKKKKQRAKNNHDQHYYEDNADELANSTTVPPPTPPPPPPPPPPTSMFHSLFRKGLGKSKKIHSVSPPPPPPPPPPSKRWSKRKSHNPPPSPPSPASPPRRRNTGRPPLPSRSVNFHDEIHESANIGNQSPLIPVPPPPPPFKMKAMKFVVRGDFVRIRSNQSSRCSSPEREEIIMNVSESTVSESVTDGNGIFCPSPDVNIKAESFIAKRRGEWKLEKLNSLKEKSNVSLPRRL